MLRSLVLYTALALGANAAAAADLEALKQGDMRKLVVYEVPLDLPEVPFLDAQGVEQRLSDHKGKDAYVAAVLHGDTTIIATLGAFFDSVERIDEVEISDGQLRVKLKE